METAIKNILVVFIFLLGLVVSVAGLAGFVPDSWFCDIASQFGPVYVVVSAICAIVLAVLKFRLGTAVLVLFLVLNGFPIVKMYVPLPSSANDVTAPHLTILNFNTEFQHNNRYDLFNRLVQDQQPDLITLVEVDNKWISALSETLKRYPYRKIVIHGPGIALFSKLPIEEIDVRYFGKSHHPRILAKVRVDEQLLNIMVAHPTTPQSEGGYRERNLEFATMREEILSMSEPKVLVGDLNCGPWSPAFRDLLKAGIRDSEQGFGPQASWPARTGRIAENIPVPPMIPIDHVLGSNDICVLLRQVGPAIYSDHLPVFVKVSLGR